MPGSATAAIALLEANRAAIRVMHPGKDHGFVVTPACFEVVKAELVDELVRLARLGLEAERSTIDLTGEAMRDCLEYLHRNDGFRSLRVRVFDGEVKLSIETAVKGLDPIAEAKGSLFHDAVANLKDGWG